jgi:long-chain acyl-CoA synthetase
VEKIWLKSYPAGMPAEVDFNKFQSLAEMFEDSCKRFSNRPAFYSLGSRLTYAKLFTLSRSFAIFLQKKLGLKKGDRIALMLPNVMQYPVALFGAWMAGLIVVNVNPLYTPRELIKQLNDADTETILVLANFAHVLQHALPETRVKNVIVTEIGDLCGVLKSHIINFITKKIKGKVPDWDIPYAISWRRALFSCVGKRLTKVELQHDDIAFLQYTGGTTGISKGAVLLHRNLLANLEQTATWMGSFLEEGKETGITVLPLYHIFALTACCLTFVRLGDSQVLIANPRDIPGLIKTLRNYPYTVFIGLTTLFSALMMNSDFKRIDFSTVKLTAAGGMAVQSTVAERWQEVTGKAVLQGYGLTEASPVVTFCPADATEFNGSVGLPLPNTEVSVRDENGVELAEGEEGELWVRGPQVMHSYWRNQAETDKVLTADGWLRTGDIVVMDEKGYIYIVDRKKDMILVAGFNVYPSEVEEVISSHPAVLEVAVVGEASVHAGEVVKAYIVRKDDSLTKDKIIAFCKDRLTSYKVPKRVEFRNQLPKSNVGKVLRRVLRDENPGD